LVISGLKIWRTNGVEITKPSTTDISTRGVAWTT